MSASLEAFVDSNVLIYAVSDDDPGKQRRAREIVDRGFAKACYAISTQVMLEVYVNVTRKAKVNMSQTEGFEYIRALTEWPVVAMTPALVLAALGLAQRSGISPWDAAILETARQAGCRTVLSEDLSGAQVYNGIRVVNPFSETGS